MNSDVCRSVSTSVVFPAPEGAESTKRIPLRLNRLLKVLDLLADFFQLGFAQDNPLRDGGVVRFCAERVQFAKNFLSDELERSPNWLVSPEMMCELSKVTFDPGQLFGNIGSISEESDFLHQ